MPVLIVPPGGKQEESARRLLEFDEPPASLLYDKKPRVLLLSFEDGAGLNLQHGCHHVVLYAPLAGSSNNSDDVVMDVGKEQQSIGRLRRPGQGHTVVVHRLVLQGPNSEDTVERALTNRNDDESLIAQASNLDG